MQAELESMLCNAGFEAIIIDRKEESREFIKHWVPGSGAENFVVSANVSATKPMSGTTGVASQSILAIAEPPVGEGCCGTAPAPAAESNEGC
jgi:hypothetical protein